MMSSIYSMFVQPKKLFKVKLTSFVASLLLLASFTSFAQPPVAAGDCGRNILEFELYSHATIGSSITNFSYSSGTIEAWVRKDNWADPVDDVLFSNGLGHTQDNSFYLSFHGAVGLHFRYGGTGQTGNTAAFTTNASTSGLASNSWHHIAATWHNDGTDTQLITYIDGVQIATAATTTNLVLTGGTFGIGQGVEGSSFDFHGGSIAEVSVWNVARTQAEIAADKDQLFMGNESNLIGYWPLNDAQGSISAANLVQPFEVATLMDMTDIPNAWVNYPLEIEADADIILSGGTYSYELTNAGASSGNITYTISNNGASSIDLLGTPIAVLSGVNADQFTLDLTGASTTLQAGGSTTFAVRFDPTTAGMKTAALSFTNVASCADAYVINLTGEATSGSLAYTGTGFSESMANDGSVMGSILITLSGDSFNDADEDSELDTDTEVTVNNIPEGLTAILTLNSTTEAELMLTGNAILHNSINDLSDITFDFEDAAFQTAAATGIRYATGQASSGLGIDFDDNLFLAQPLLVPGECSRNILEFEPGSYADIGSITDFNYASGTIEAWVRKDTWVEPVNNALFSNGLHSFFNNSFHISFNSDDGLIFTYGGESQTGNAAAFNSVASTNSFAENSWHHVAATWYNDGSTTQLTTYIDGSQIASASTTTNLILSGGTSFGIGKGHISLIEDFQGGAIAEFRIWDIARTPVEIAADKNHVLSGYETNLIGYWPFDDAQGSTTADNLARPSEVATLMGMTDIPNAWVNYPLEIEVAGDDIFSGDSYDYGLTEIGTGSGSPTYTISNNGASSVDLIGTPIAVLSGTNADQFTLDFASTSATLAAGASTTFSVSFNPTSLGTKAAAFSFSNATSCADPFVINLTGEGASGKLTYTGLGFSESMSDDGSVTGSIIITLSGDSFNNSDEDGELDTDSEFPEVIINNIPAGLTPVLSLNSSTEAVLILTGNANDHKRVNDVSDITFEFADEAFNVLAASIIEGAAGPASSGLGIGFEGGASITYGGSGFSETAVDNGAIEGSITITLSGGASWNDADADGKLAVGSQVQVVINNIPEGLNPVVSLTAGEVAVLTFSGSATDHQNDDDVPDITFEFNDAAFDAPQTAAIIVNATGPASSGLGIDFEENPVIVYSGDGFAETMANMGSVTGSIIITLTGDTFQDTDMDNLLDVDTEVTIINIPTGLTPILTLNSSTEAELTLIGSAVAHADADDVSDITFEFEDEVFVNSNVTAVFNTGLFLTSLRGIDFDVVNTGWTITGRSGIFTNDIDQTTIIFDQNDVPYIGFKDDIGENPYNGKISVMRFNGTNLEYVGSEKFSPSHVRDPYMALNSHSTPYVVFGNSTNSDKAMVMKYNGSDWENVGGTGFSNGKAYNTKIAINSQDEVYVAYRDEANNDKTTVMKYNGTSWDVVGSAGFSAGSGQSNSLKFDSNDVPYVAYKDGANSFKATVMKYNGATWEVVGAAGFSSGVADQVQLVLDSQDTLYVAFSDGSVDNKTTVMKYNGTTWGLVGSAGISMGRTFSQGLGVDSSDKPYVAFVDNGNDSKTTVMKYNSMAWEAVGSEGFSPSSARAISLNLDSNDNPYVAFGDDIINDRLTVMQNVVPKPITANTTVSVFGGNPLTLSTSDFAFTGILVSDVLDHIELTSIPVGTLFVDADDSDARDNGEVALAIGDAISKTELDADQLKFIPGVSDTDFRFKVSDGTVFSSAKTVTITEDLWIWDGAAWNNISAPTSTDNAIIDGDFDFSLDGTFEANDLEVATGVTLTADAENTLTVNGDLVSDGAIIVESGSSLITYEANSITGNDITFKRNTRYADGKYSFVGTPVEQDASIIGSDLGSYVYKYNEVTAYGADGINRWEDASPDELIPAKGYTQADQQEIIFFGVPNTGTITHSGTYTEDTDDANEGWNLVANPYAAAIDVADFLLANTNTSGSVYIWDDNGSDSQRGTNADYLVANAMIATNSTPANMGNRYNQYLGSAQAFFVKLDDNTDTNISFTESMRRADNNSDDHFFRESDLPVVRLNLTNSVGLFKQAVIGFANDAREDKLNRKYDAQAFNGASGYGLFTMKAGRSLTLNGMPQNWEYIQLQLNTKDAGSYKISMELEAYSQSIYLKDNLTSEVIDLSNEPYYFTSEAGVHIDRFQLTSSFAVLGTEQEEVFAYAFGKTLYVKTNANAIAHYQLYNLSGKYVTNFSTNGNTQIDLSDLPNGVYILFDGKKSQKVVLK